MKYSSKCPVYKGNKKHYALFYEQQNLRNHYPQGFASLYCSPTVKDGIIQ